MRKLMLLSAFAIAATLGTANAQSGGMQGQGGMMNQGMSGDMHEGVKKKKMSKKHMRMMKKKKMRHNM